MAVHRRTQALRTLFASLALALTAACASHAEKPNNGAACNDYASQSSGNEVLVSGHVVALLGTRESRSGKHEGYLVKLNKNCDLLLKVETNTSITGPIPFTHDEPIVLKGVYVYDPLGGLIHWTHHDPSGRHMNGYVIAGGKSYR